MTDLNSPLPMPWAFAWGSPTVRGKIRVHPEDFEVDEELGYALSGDGEHLCVWIEKIGQNTGWVAERLAQVCGVSPRTVSYTGLKDRHALTRQWFSVHLPGKADPDLGALNGEGVRLVKQTRHNRKLRIGALQGNRFRIVVRDVQGDIETLGARLQKIAVEGVPNYFGEQRFGHKGDNISKAKAMFTGALRPRHAQKSIYLSAARSWLFNEVLSERIRQNAWRDFIPGDVFMLDGSHSIFGFADASTDELRSRLAQGDIHITGPLCGKPGSRNMLTEQAAALETKILAGFPEICTGLEAAGLKAERRALRVIPGELQWQFDNSNLVLSFSLPAGSYATAVLREMIDYSVHGGQKDNF